MLMLVCVILCYSLACLGLFGIALYVTSAENRRLRAALAGLTETPVAKVAPRLREAEWLPCWN
jgi:hypothetical protein